MYKYVPRGSELRTVVRDAVCGVGRSLLHGWARFLSFVLERALNFLHMECTRKTLNSGLLSVCSLSGLFSLPRFPTKNPTSYPLASFDDTLLSFVGDAFASLASLPPVPALTAPRPQLQLHSLRPPPPSADRSVLLN